MEVRTFPPKEVVAAEGEADEALFVIQSGEVAIIHRGGSKLNGTEQLAVLHRGECFGEQALVGGGALGKPSKRKVSAVVHGTQPLTTLMLRPEGLAAVDGIDTWRAELTHAIAHHAVAGVDWAVSGKRESAPDSLRGAMTSGKQAAAAELRPALACERRPARSSPPVALPAARVLPRPMAKASSTRDSTPVSCELSLTC